MRLIDFIRPARREEPLGDALMVLDRNPWAPVGWYCRGTTRLPREGHPGRYLVALGGCGVLLTCATLESRPSAVSGFLGLCLTAVFAIGLCGMMLYSVRQYFCGREQLRVDERGLDYRLDDGWTTYRRAIPFAEVRRLIPYYRQVPSHKTHRGIPVFGLAIETTGRTLRAGESYDREAAEGFRDDLRAAIADRCPAWSEAPEAADREILDAAGTLPEPPSDSRLACRREWDRIEFVLSRRGGEGLMASDRLPARLFVFLTPVLAAMLAVVLPITAGLLAITWLGAIVATSPLKRRWVIRPGEITRAVTLCGLGRSRTTDIEWLSRLELRKRPMRSFLRGPVFDLVLVDPDDADRAALGPLTEGEARWMAGIVADVLKDALPREGEEVYRWSVSVDGPAAGSIKMADPWLDDPGTKGPATEKRA